MFNHNLFIWENDSLDIFSIVFTVITILIICVFIAIVVMAIRKCIKINNSPRLNSQAKVISKRTALSCYANTSNIVNSANSTYYVTFEFDSGDNYELSVTEQEYESLSEGESGIVCFQGTRFLSFERTSEEFVVKN